VKYEDQVKVTLVEGSVLVSNDGNAGGYRLGPSMQASYHTGDFEPQLEQSDDSGNSLAWRSGKLVLDNLSLEQALPVINRYLDKPLRLADDSTAGSASAASTTPAKWGRHPAQGAAGVPQARTAAPSQPHAAEQPATGRQQGIQRIRC
jgi:hypothetical protein